MVSDRFDPGRAANLESAERRMAVVPQEILAAAGASPGMICADLGSGTGFFTRPLSRMVGPHGTVCSIDASLEMLRYQRGLLDGQTDGEVHLIAAQVERVPLRSALLDLCLTCFVLHEVENRAALFSEIHRLVRPGGRLLLVDWAAIEPPPGPDLARRVPRDVALREAAAAGLVLLTEIPQPAQHYALVLQRV